MHNPLNCQQIVPLMANGFCGSPPHFCCQTHHQNCCSVPSGGCNNVPVIVLTLPQQGVATPPTESVGGGTPVARRPQETPIRRYTLPLINISDYVAEIENIFEEVPKKPEFSKSPLQQSRGSSCQKTIPISAQKLPGSSRLSANIIEQVSKKPESPKGPPQQTRRSLFPKTSPRSAQNLPGSSRLSANIIEEVPKKPESPKSSPQQTRRSLSLKTPPRTAQNLPGTSELSAYAGVFAGSPVRPQSMRSLVDGDKSKLTQSQQKHYKSLKEHRENAQKAIEKAADIQHEITGMKKNQIYKTDRDQQERMLQLINNINDIKYELVREMFSWRKARDNMHNLQIQKQKMEQELKEEIPKEEEYGTPSVVVKNESPPFSSTRINLDMFHSVPEASQPSETFHSLAQDEHQSGEDGGPTPRGSSLIANLSAVAKRAATRPFKQAADVFKFESPGLSKTRWTDSVRQNYDKFKTHMSNIREAFNLGEKLQTEIEQIQQQQLYKQDEKERQRLIELLKNFFSIRRNVLENFFGRGVALGKIDQKTKQEREQLVRQSLTEPTKCPKKRGNRSV